MYVCFEDWHAEIFWKGAILLLSFCRDFSIYFSTRNRIRDIFFSRHNILFRAKRGTKYCVKNLSSIEK